MGVKGGIGSILMLSSASAPSRVPQVVCQRVSHQSSRLGEGARWKRTSVTVMQPYSLIRLWK
jgi:hypothetical protein